MFEYLVGKNTHKMSELEEILENIIKILDLKL